MQLISARPESLKKYSLSDSKFYHSFDLPSDIFVEGEWDLRGNVDDYLGNQPFQSRSVLDIGTASGFLTFEMEKRGANVVSMEADSVRRINLLPFVSHPTISDYENWVIEGEKFLDKQKSSYWYAHEAFESKALVYYGDVYDLPSTLGKFDTVVVAQILVHLRDPVQALTTIAKLCSDTLIIAEGMIDSAKPFAQYLPINPETPASIWWHYSEGLYAEILKLMGFEIIQRSVKGYRCITYNTNVPITTLVCKRIK